jgi:hypothetical protein
MHLKMMYHQAIQFQLFMEKVAGITSIYPGSRQKNCQPGSGSPEPYSATGI